MFQIFELLNTRLFTKLSPEAIRLRRKNYKIQKLEGGFTLIELLVTVALSAIVIVGSLFMLSGYNAGKHLQSEGGQLVAALQNARQNSIAQQSGARWGVHLTNGTSTQNYSLFSGLSYASGTVANTYAFRGLIQFGNPSASSSLDVIFNPNTGYLPSPQVLTLNNGKGDGLIYDVAIDTLGKITAKYDTGLVGYWHFDEGASSTAYDAAGLGNDGALQNSSMWAAGTSCKAGNCLSLNGSDYAESQNPAGFSFGSGSASIVVWFKTAVSSGALVTKRTGSGFQMYVLSTKFYADGAGTAGVSSNGAVNDGLWHQGVVVYDRPSSLLRLYIDGQPDNTVALGSTTLTDSANLEFGRALLGGTPRDYFTGTIDEVRIYDRALSATEILDQYNALQ